MKKIYFFLHFLLIFIISFLGVINSYVIYNNDNKNENTHTKLSKSINNIISSIVNNPIYHTYAIFSGTNTGYGFYGINVSTYKYFKVEIFDKDGKLIKTTSNFGLKTSNSLSRFEVLANKISHNIVEKNKISDDIKNNKEKEVKDLYINKIFKVIGKYEAKKENNCHHYKVTLYTLIPDDIWNKKKSNKLKVSEYESIIFYQ
ncbi:hypothetical protein [Bergeyella zoohelcum]|uniref:Uncharacterized protein n=1 Tax=Bergeyella zoohelcum TaxID=1015 RepID=A0A7Z8YP56_9FLAO|nr:hypothetical protein [Bergeyella zoohelcum]VDH02977.1 Uncharacterised protein [Bergeyella zoohelcum]